MVMTKGTGVLDVCGRRKFPFIFPLPRRLSSICGLVLAYATAPKVANEPMVAGGIWAGTIYMALIATWP